MTRGRIKRHFVYQHLGTFHEKEYNAVVKELIGDGALQAARKNINDDDTLTFASRQESLL